VGQVSSANEAKLLPAGLREAETQVTRTEVTKHKSLKLSFENMRERSRAMPAGWTVLVRRINRPINYMRTAEIFLKI